ncbi:phage tail protein [Pseudocitrobacter faecalis]|uniref:phage tail fiber protein n=1 Tax=Pseudocitrobacter faecalis TaxID=1398493 RepID=UPI0039F0D7C3
MSAGTITLTNKSAVVSGNGTAFTTELAAGDFIVATVGGIAYTLPVLSISSATSLTLVSDFTGPTQSGNAWNAVPRVALNMVTAALVTQSAEALRGLNYDKQNWQSVFTGTGTITVTLPDGSSFSGPSWKYLSDNMATKPGGSVPITQGGTGSTTAAGARTNLGLGSSSTYNVGSNLNEVLTVGVFGLGFSSNITGIYDYWDRTAFLSTTAQTEGFPGNGQGTMISVVHRNNTTYGSRWIGSADGRAFFQSKSNNSLSASYELCMIGKSVTVDSNGFIKKSSPVINIFTDGRYETNEESEGCVVTRQGLGEYLIEGCTGLNSDAAWGGVDGGFELPVDRNRQPLIWLDYEVNADGSVLVKTYHRTNPGAPAFARNEIEGLADGDPVDIPTDQFVSVRVQMPACSIWNQKQEEAIDAMMKFEPEESTDLQQD